MRAAAGPHFVSARWAALHCAGDGAAAKFPPELLQSIGRCTVARLARLDEAGAAITRDPALIYIANPGG